MATYILKIDARNKAAKAVLEFLFNFIAQRVDILFKLPANPAKA